VTPARWEWDAAAGPARVVAELAAAGVAWVHAPEIAEKAAGDPWAAAERVLGGRPLLVERQPIRAVPGGRSFSSGCMAAPFHTDSQMLLGVPPHVQVMACARAAERGGENLYLDTWCLLARIEREDPTLLADLFTSPRRQPFVFGDVSGPTVTRRGGSLVFTHTARPLPDDGVAARLRPFVDSAEVIEVRADAGDLVILQNHRMLHGRRAFRDDRRSFTRVLAWRPDPWPAPEHWMARAACAADVLDPRVGDALGRVRDSGGHVPSAPVTDHELAAVREVLRGIPPGVVSARQGVPEPDLYRWRDAVVSGFRT
jgi:gamma-butyrobetaine dioxygenase